MISKFKNNTWIYEDTVIFHSGEAFLTKNLNLNIPITNEPICKENLNSNSRYIKNSLPLPYVKKSSWQKPYLNSKSLTPSSTSNNWSWIYNYFFTNY